VGSVAAVAAIALAVDLRGDVAARDRQLARLAAQLQAQPEIRYVAVLADDRGPSLLATFDPRHNVLTLKRVGSFQEGADQSLQLWALPEGGAPKSLGVLPAGPVVRLVALEPQLRQSPALAVSLEPKGGVASETGPTGPVLFKGAVLQTPL
jgi:anti-sigma-K factor RskA